MMRTSILRGVAALGLTVLAACGNGTEQKQSLNTIKQSVMGLLSGGSDAAPAGVSVDQIATALAARPEPHAFVHIESRNVQSLVIQIAQNGPYRTFATGDRRTIIFRNGMITATRGLGGDLMSSEEDALLALLSSRSAGSAPYVMRFLDGAEQTVELRYTCTTTPGAQVPVQLGEVNAVGTAMVAECVSARTKFSSTFVVDAQGRILSARQWLGRYTGYITSQQLRL